MKTIDFYLDHSCKIRDIYNDEEFLNNAYMTQAINTRFNELTAKGIEITDEVLSKSSLVYNGQSVTLDKVLNQVSPVISLIGECDSCIIKGAGFLKCRGEINIPFDEKTIQYLISHVHNIKNKEWLEITLDWINLKKINGSKSITYLNKDEAIFLDIRGITINQVYDWLFFHKTLERRDLFFILIIMDAISIKPILPQPKSMFNFLRNSKRHSNKDDIYVMEEYNCEIRLDTSEITGLYQEDLVNFLVIAFKALKSNLNMKFCYS